LEGNQNAMKCTIPVATIDTGTLIPTQYKVRIL